MKTFLKSTLLTAVSTIFLNHFSIAQSKHSCCSTASTTEFAMLGKNESFRSSHLSPLPFHFVPVKGKLISIKAGDGKQATVFEVRADMPTENYLFVIHEWWGLNDYIKQEAEKLQEELGNVNVLALDLYDGKVAANKEDAGKYMGEAKEERIRAIINGAISYAGKEAHIQTIGWCFGGGWSLQTSI
ncbi:MAG: dienelactone hydrolase family protein, partial [Bacteroidia bacterium]|nr:dienelactone hydrolase family protein [Bacteroidia bacterium]